MTELVWDVYRCECGGEALMGLVSLVAHCPDCPRVYARFAINKGAWFANIDEANAAYRASREERAQKHTPGEPEPSTEK